MWRPRTWNATITLLSDQPDNRLMLCMSKPQTSRGTLHVSPSPPRCAISATPRPLRDILRPEDADSNAARRLCRMHAPLGYETSGHPRPHQTSRLAWARAAESAAKVARAALVTVALCIRLRNIPSASTYAGVRVDVYISGPCVTSHLSGCARNDRPRDSSCPPAAPASGPCLRKLPG